MVRLSRVVIWLVAWLPLPMPAHGAQASVDEGALRGWIGAALRGWPKQGASGLIVEWTREVGTTRDPAAITARLREIEAFPEHPELRGLRYHERLSRAPERSSGTLAYADGGAWWLHELHESRESHGEQREFSCGGAGNVRWMLSRTGERGQLTIIRAGVAFPAVYNIGRFHEDARQRVALLGWGSLAEFGRPDRIESIHATASGWRATAFEAGTERRVELEGDVDGGTGEPRLRRARVIEAGAPAGNIGQAVLFDQPAWSDALGRTYARSVTIERADGIRERYEVMRIERASTSAISAGAAVPAVEPGVVVLDYREPNAPSWAPYAESPRLTWHRRAQGEQYETSLAPGDAGAGGTTPAGSSGRRLMYAIGLVVVVGGIVPLVLRYIRKR